MIYATCVLLGFGAGYFCAALMASTRIREAEWRYERLFMETFGGRK